MSFPGSAQERGVADRGTNPSDRGTRIKGKQPQENAPSPPVSERTRPAERGITTVQPTELGRSPVSKIDSAVERIEYVLDSPVLGLKNRNNLAASCLSILRDTSLNLSAQDIRVVVNRLANKERIGEFLSLFRYPKHPSVETLGAFLVRQGVPLNYIFNYYEVTFADCDAFLSGYAQAMIQDAVEGIMFIAYFVKHTVVDTAAAAAEKIGLINEETAKIIRRDSQQFFKSISDFIRNDPLAKMYQSAIELVDNYEKALCELDFLKAGHFFGKITLILLTAATAVKTIWKLIRKIPAAVQSVKIAYAAFERAVSRAILEAVLNAPSRRLVTSTGDVLAVVGDELYMMSSRGDNVRHIALSEVIDGLEKSVKETASSSIKGRSKGTSSRLSKFKPKSRLLEIKYIEELKKRYPKLKEVNIQPRKRPSVGRSEGAPEYAFEERMQTTQGNYSYNIYDKRGKILIEFDGISIDGFIEEIKISQTLEKVDKIMADLRRQADFAKAYDLNGVKYSIKPPEVAEAVEARVAEEMLRNVYRAE